METVYALPSFLPQQPLIDLLHFGLVAEQVVTQATKEFVEMRDRWLNAEGLPEAERKKRALTNLYNARPTWLDLAHKKLDTAVFAAYGLQSDLSDDQILEGLLALNLERAG